MRVTTMTGTGAAQGRRPVELSGSWIRRAADALLLLLIAIVCQPVPGAFASEPPLSGSVAEFAPDASPEEIPELTILGADGAPLPAEAFFGRLVVLNVWATWCAPCLREMPALDALQAHYDPNEVRVVTLSVDRAGARAVRKFYAEQKLGNLGVFLDPKGEAMRALGIKRLPTTLLLDGLDRRFGILEGVAEWDAAEAKALIDYYQAKIKN